MLLCSEDDKDVVSEKIDKLKEKYRVQLRLSKDMRSKYAEASELSHNLFGANEELMKWLEDMEGKLTDAQKEEQEAEEQQEKLKVCLLFV